MASKINLSKFNQIYDKTYLDILKYVIVKCHDINDTSDIVQEIYLELWNILNKKELDDINIKSYLIGIANNKIKKHFSLLSKFKTISLFQKNDLDLELVETIKDPISIEDIFVKKGNWDDIWNYLKRMKNQDIAKVFYLYYGLDFSIKEVASELGTSVSYIKHLLYRTLKKLQDNFGGGGEINDK